MNLITLSDNLESDNIIFKRLSFYLVTYLSLKVVIMMFQLIFFFWVLFCGGEINSPAESGNMLSVVSLVVRLVVKKMLQSIEIHDFLVQLNVIFTWCLFLHYTAMLSSINLQACRIWYNFANEASFVIHLVTHWLCSSIGGMSIIC